MALLDSRLQPVSRPAHKDRLKARFRKRAPNVKRAPVAPAAGGGVITNAGGNDLLSFRGGVASGGISALVVYRGILSG